MSTPFDYIPAVLDRAVEDAQPIDVKGKVIQVVGTIIKASVPGVKVGEVCILRNPWENFEVQAEVVGFTRDAVLLTALGPMIGISAETEVIPTRNALMVPVGHNLLARVLDGLGRPMDADVKGPLRPDGYYPVEAAPPSSLERRIITTPISLGVRAIDGLLTCGEGQRMGIFAAAGGGKATLLASITRNPAAEARDGVHEQDDLVPLVAEPFGDGGGDVGGLEALHGGAVGRGDDEDGLLESLGAEVLLDELAHFASALADERQHSDFGLGIADN